MRTLRFFISVVVSFVLLASTAFAFGEIRYTDRPLNLRDGRSPKATWVGNMYPGQKVRIAHLKDGWVAIYEPHARNGSEDAAIGFANVKYLKKERTRYEPKEWGEMVYTPRVLNVRTRPSIKGRKITSLRANQHVRIDFPDGDWSMVFSPDATIRSRLNGIGFSSAKYFKPATKASMAKAGIGRKPAPVQEEPAMPTVQEEPVIVEAGSGEGQVSGSVAPPPAPAKPVVAAPRLVSVTQAVNVRQSRTSGSPLVKTLKPGDLVQVGLLRSGWYAVFDEFERVHSESRSMGYALESLIDKGTEAAKARPEPVKVAAPAPKPAPKPAPAPKAEAPKEVKKAAESKPVAISKDEARQAATAQPSSGDQQTMVIDRSKFEGKKRPDPTPNKSAHGYQYRFLEKSETRQFGEVWITLKVFLSTSKLPSRSGLEDFATTLWKDHKRVTKNVAVLIYLPGMDTEDLAYGVIKFDDERLLELWVRKATLFGTKFL